MSPGVLGQYLVAFSFAGQEITLVRSIAEAVREVLGQDSVFFYEWYEHLLAGEDADLKLQQLYARDCTLVVACVSRPYGERPWTRLEHAAIRSRYMQATPTSGQNPLSVLPIRVGEGDVPGLPFNAIVPDVSGRTPQDTAQLILKRLQVVDPSIQVAGVGSPAGRPATIRPFVAPAPPAPAPPPADVVKLKPVDSPPLVTHGNVQFAALEYKHLKKVCVVAQSLDNQWVPRALLRRMLNERLSLADVEVERERYVRSEYVRALINAEQVVINRAYLYNNPAVSRDYTRPGLNRDAFKNFLSQGVIVPFLFNENSPVDEPDYRTLSFPAWKELSQEVQMRCVRLSWAEDNRRKIDRLLAARFHNFPRTAIDRDVDVFLDHLELPANARDPFKRRLRQISDYSADFSERDKKVAREDLYQKFVVADGTSPAAGQYDASKEFGAEIKQLLDLCYNVNLPDALGRYALTPFDSLPRAALQDWQVVREAPVEVDQLIVLLQRAAFDILQRGMYLASFGDLTLADVRAVRQTDEWMLYVQSLDELIRNPLSFADSEGGASKVYGSYTKLMRVITSYLADRRQEAWQPVASVEVELAGKRLVLTWTDQGKQYNIDGSLSDVYRPGEAPVRVRLNIRDGSANVKQADLATNVDFLRGHVENAQEQWNELIRRIEEFQNITLVPEDQSPKMARLNRPESEAA